MSGGLRKAGDVGHCEGCLWSLSIHFLSPSARGGVLADEARMVAIAPECIRDLLLSLCPLNA